MDEIWQDILVTYYNHIQNNKVFSNFTNELHK